MMSKLDWNPRYANYARVHGNSPEEQILLDRAKWPGGAMAGFILWNRSRLQEYSKINPDAFMHGGLRDHAAYDKWLDEYPMQEDRNAGRAALAEDAP